MRNFVMIACAVGLMTTGLAATALASSPTERIDEAVQVLREMSQQEDYEAMAYILKKAHGVAIFPSVL
ncbi:MAG: hypothetical protein QME82_09840, partial [Bacillota bacterium]|nr:hypothetical protein [Bacillota bacterium]